MRFFLLSLLIVFAACVPPASAEPKDDPPISPRIELQSGPLTPGVVLEESPRPIHQIRLVVDTKLKRGILILDGNRPEFDEFGKLVGGLQTPHVRAQGDPTLIRKLVCNIEFLKASPDKWHLYSINGPDIDTPLRIATRGSLADGGPARVVSLNSKNETSVVVACTRYGLVLP